MELKMKSPAMMTLIAMGISVAYIYSLYSFIVNKINPHEHVMDFLGISYFDCHYAIRALGGNECSIECQQCLEEISRIAAR